VRTKNLLIVGSAYRKPAHFPQCDATWTVLHVVNDDRNVLSLPNIRVWDCHDRPEVVANRYDVPVLDLRDNKDVWRPLVSTHGPKFANQLCYMLADVAQENSPFNHVTLFGVGGYDAEHVHQFQYMAYWLGYLNGIGVSHTICQPSALLRPSTYVDWKNVRKQ
jgi:hypothetical protein